MAEADNDLDAPAVAPDAYTEEYYRGVSAGSEEWNRSGGSEVSPHAAAATRGPSRTSRHQSSSIISVHGCAQRAAKPLLKAELLEIANSLGFNLKDVRDRAPMRPALCSKNIC